MPLPINISTSRGASILGLSKWSTPVQVWLQIMEAREPGFCAANNYELSVVEYSAPMRWGHAFESSIIELAEPATGLSIRQREEFFMGPDEYMTCHIDGLYKDSDPFALHEGKTTTIHSFKDEWGEPGTDQVPVDYQIQCQHQMICTGAEKVILSVLVFPRRVEEWEEMGIIPKKNDSGEYYLDGGSFMAGAGAWAFILAQMGYFHQYRISSHPELQAHMLTAYREFWERHVIGKTPPEPRTYDDIRALVREPVGTIVATDEISRLMAEYKNIGQEIGASGALAKRREQIKVAVLEFMRHAGATPDDESRDRWVLRDQAGRKIGSYGRTEKGIYIFR